MTTFRGRASRAPAWNRKSGTRPQPITPPSPSRSGNALPLGRDMASRPLVLAGSGMRRRPMPGPRGPVEMRGVRFPLLWQGGAVAEAVAVPVAQPAVPRSRLGCRAGSEGEQEFAAPTGAEALRRGGGGWRPRLDAKVRCREESGAGARSDAPCRCSRERRRVSRHRTWHRLVICWLVV